MRLLSMRIQDEGSNAPTNSTMLLLLDGTHYGTSMVSHVCKRDSTSTLLYLTFGTPSNFFLCYAFYKMSLVRYCKRHKKSFEDKMFYFKISEYISCQLCGYWIERKGSAISSRCTFGMGFLFLPPPIHHHPGALSSASTHAWPCKATGNFFLPFSCELFLPTHTTHSICT